MGKSTNPAIPGFVLLGPSIQVKGKQEFSSSPSSFASTTGIGDPHLIIITSWTGANPKHIAKYTQNYMALYPFCPILVIATSIEDLTMRSTEQKIATLAPAVEYIEDLIVSRYTYNFNILLHAFSEGGSNKAVCLARAFLAKAKYQLPIAAYIFDSTPGTPRFSNNVAAFKRSLPENPVIRFLGFFLGIFFVAAMEILHSIFVPYDNNIIAKTRKAINDASLWPIAGIPRTYMFSEADDLIWWKDVQEHAEMSAKEFGVVCLMVKYKASRHCDHMRLNEEYYWSAVRKTWETRDVEIGAVTNYYQK